MTRPDQTLTIFAFHGLGKVSWAAENLVVAIIPREGCDGQIPFLAAVLDARKKHLDGSVDGLRGLIKPSHVRAS